MVNPKLVTSSKAPINQTKFKLTVAQRGDKAWPHGPLTTAWLFLCGRK